MSECAVCEGSGGWARDGGREEVTCEACNGCASTPDAAPVEVEGEAVELAARITGSDSICERVTITVGEAFICAFWAPRPHAARLVDAVSQPRPAAPTTPDIADERVRGMLREAQEFVDAHCADDLSRRIDVALAHCPVCDAEDGPDRDCPTHGKAEGVREP